MAELNANYDKIRGLIKSQCAKLFNCEMFLWHFWLTSQTLTRLSNAISEILFGTTKAIITSINTILEKLELNRIYWQIKTMNKYY